MRWMGGVAVLKPILFNTDMVRAILEDRKTVTRRVMKPQPSIECTHGGQHEFIRDDFTDGSSFTGFFCKKCGCGVCGPHFKFPVGTSWIRPIYRPGDILYVRETWEIIGTDGTHHKYGYKADNQWLVPLWRPSIHMPREAARIFLRVKDVRVERLQDISASACIAEGIPWEDVTPNIAALPDNPAFDMDAVVSSLQEAEEQKLIRNSYGLLWDSIIKPKDIALYGWEANPWVWVIEFERCGKPTEGPT